MEGLALAMVFEEAIVLIPFGVAGGGTALLDPHVLAVGAGVAVLSSAIPYSLELEALRRLPTGTFGVLMSIEPAVAALLRPGGARPGAPPPRMGGDRAGGGGQRGRGHRRHEGDRTPRLIGGRR